MTQDTTGLPAWRALGDTIASAFALGYHEDVAAKSDVPSFLVELRRTAFARLYSGDKNVAIFVGRPPRMSKRFCFFQIPTDCVSSPFGPGVVHHWNLESKMSYRSETRWSAVCASVKEEILEIFGQQSRAADPMRMMSAYLDLTVSALLTRL